MSSIYLWEQPITGDKDIFRSGAQVLVNPVNCVGVMGAGLAKQFREKYPTMYKNYRADCKCGRYRPGWVYMEHVYDGHFIANMATKNDWRDPSETKWVIEGIRQLRETLDSTPKLQSVAIPRIGCGLGGLDWNDIRPFIIAGMTGCRCDVWVDGEMFRRDKDGINRMRDKEKRYTVAEIKGISDICHISMNSDFMKAMLDNAKETVPKINTTKTVQCCKYCGTPITVAEVSVRENGKSQGIAVCGKCLEEALGLLSVKHAQKTAGQPLKNPTQQHTRPNWRDEPMTAKQKEFIKRVSPDYAEFKGNTRGEACDYIKKFLEKNKEKQEKESWTAEAMFDSFWGGMDQR